MGELYDAPNQQVVRADGSGPWDEGSGGEVAEPEPQSQEQEAEPQQEQAEPQQVDDPAQQEKAALKRSPKTKG